MKHLFAAALFVTAAPLWAGDAAIGENDFKKCRSCHSIVSDTETIVKGGKTGPNLYNVVGRLAGTEDFKYSEAMIALGVAGMIWTEDLIAEFVADPTAFLKVHSGDDGARSKMTFKLAKAEDVAAYLVTVSPDAPAEEEGEEAEETTESGS